MKDIKRRESLRVRLKKFLHRKTTTEKRADPFKILVNGDEHFPIFVDIRENLLITGQAFSAAPAYGIDLTKQLLIKKHIIHATVNYEAADTIWFFLHTYGFVTDKTADRQIERWGLKKNAPRFAFHLFTDKHHVVEDSVNGGKILDEEIHPNTLVDVVFYLKDHAHPLAGSILEGDSTLSEKINALCDLPGSLITKLRYQDGDEKTEIPIPSSLTAGFNHIVICSKASETAFEYKNRLHMRDTVSALDIYFKERRYEFGWNLHLCPLGNWVVVTPDNEPILQRSSSVRSKVGYSFNRKYGQ